MIYLHLCIHLLIIIVHSYLLQFNKNQHRSILQLGKQNSHEDKLIMYLFAINCYCFPYGSSLPLNVRVVKAEHAPKENNNILYEIYGGQINLSLTLRIFYLLKSRPALNFYRIIDTKTLLLICSQPNQCHTNFSLHILVTEPTALFHIS